MGHVLRTVDVYILDFFFDAEHIELLLIVSCFLAADVQVLNISHRPTSHLPCCLLRKVPRLSVTANLRVLKKTPALQLAAARNTTLSAQELVSRDLRLREYIFISSPRQIHRLPQHLDVTRPTANLLHLPHLRVTCLRLGLDVGSRSSHELRLSSVVGVMTLLVIFL